MNLIKNIPPVINNVDCNGNVVVLETQDLRVEIYESLDINRLEDVDDRIGFLECISTKTPQTKFKEVICK